MTTAPRFYALTPFIAPGFGLLVPDWTFGAATERYRAADRSYEGPLYLLLTPDDVAVLVNYTPNEDPNALHLLCRKPHQGWVDHQPPAHSLRQARRDEARVALRRLAAKRQCHRDALPSASTVWIVGTTAFCVHDAPHRVTLFAMRDGACTAVIETTDRDWIAPIPEA